MVYVYVTLNKVFNCQPVHCQACSLQCSLFLSTYRHTMSLATKNTSHWFHHEQLQVYKRCLSNSLRFGRSQKHPQWRWQWQLKFIETR